MAKKRTTSKKASKVTPKDVAKKAEELKEKEAQDVKDVKEEVKESETVKEETKKETVAEEPKKEVVKEEKPEVPEAPKAVEKKENKALTLLKKYIERYNELSNKKFLSNTEQRERVNMLITIVRSVMSTTDVELINEVIEFFKKNRNNSLHPFVVFKGLEKFPKDTADKVTAFYTLIMEVVEAKAKKKKLAIDLKAVRIVLDNDTLVNRIANMIK